MPAQVWVDHFGEIYSRTGFYSTICWYRNAKLNALDAAAYGDQIIRQPSGFMCGDKELALILFPQALESQRALCADLRRELIIPGAGHGIHQERPADVSAALIGFLDEVRERL